MNLSEALGQGNVVLEELIRAKNPRLLGRIPRCALRYLKRILHLDSVNGTIRANPGAKGVEFADRVLAEMQVAYQAHGLEALPEQGRYLFVSNHPLGGLDGLVLISSIGHRWPELYFPVNDFLTLIPQFQDIFIPINKHGAQSQSAAQRLNEAYASNGQVLYFPAGLCSRRIRGQIVDLEWKSNFIAKAIEFRRAVVPIFFGGRNSRWFYNLAWLRHFLRIKVNIEMLYLVDEMYRQQGTTLDLQVGTPIAWETFTCSSHDRQGWANWVREQVYRLGEKLG